MKQIILAIFLLVITQPLVAQNFMLGAKAGLNYSRLSMSNTEISVGSLNTAFKENTQYTTGFVAGGFARLKFSSLYFQPELLFAMKGGTFDRIKSGGITGGLIETKTVDVQMYGVDIPLLLGYQISKFRVNGGLLASFNLSSMNDFKAAIQEYSTNPADASKTAVFGYLVGVGVDLGKFTADLRYEGNFSALTSARIQVPNNDFTLDQRTSLFQFTVGYNFLD